LKFTELTPAAVIPVAGSGVISTATDGKTIWAVSPAALLKVDVNTNAVESVDAPVLPDDTTLALADDGLWVARWAGGKLYRLDPQTGEVQLEAPLPSAVNIQFLGDDMWVGQESKHSMFKVDRSTGEIDPTTQLDGSAYATAGAGQFWFVDHQMVKSIDPETKEVTPVFDITGESNCARGVGGNFPEAVWTGCFERDLIERSIARINLATKTVTALVNLPPTNGGGVTTIGDHDWFYGGFKDTDGKPIAGLLRIDPQTAQVDRFFSVTGADLDGVFTTGDALWMVDEVGHVRFKLNIADLS
jgi:streptogramin lyase